MNKEGKTGSSLTSGQHVLLVTAFVGAITAAFVTISGGGQSPEQGSSQEAVEDQEVSQDSKPVLAPAGAVSDSETPGQLPRTPGITVSGNGACPGAGMVRRASVTTHVFRL